MYLKWIGLDMKHETCSKHENHSRLSSQHDQEDLYDHLMSTRNFTLILNKIWTPKVIRKAAMASIWISTYHLILIMCFVS